MRHQKLLGRAATLAGLVLALAAATAPPPVLPAQELRESDHKKLGDLLERYFDKLDSVKDSGKARENLRGELEKIGKKIAGKDGDPLQAALALTADLGHAVGLSYDYKNQRGGRLMGKELDARGTDMEYGLWLPPSYKVSDGPYPLVLIAPDVKDGKPMSGELLLQEYWIEPELRDGLILAAVTLPEEVASWTELFVEDGSGRREPGGLSYLMNVYADVRSQVAVDVDRVYVAGRGAGVAAAMRLGSIFPHIFAGVIGQAGDAGEPTWENFRNLPTFLQGGGGQATAFAEKVNDEAGYDNATVTPTATPEELWTWIQDHPRVSNPSEVMLVPGSPIPTRAYWLEVPPTDVEEGTFVKATADRASNTIRVEGKGVRSVVVYLNDVLLDLDQPIKMVLNGQEQELVVPRSLDDFLSLLVRGTTDAGRVYVAVARFDLPE